jgi:hypothetical protein
MTNEFFKGKMRNDGIGKYYEKQIFQDFAFMRVAADVHNGQFRAEKG